jgi:hypothetical protein
MGRTWRGRKCYGDWGRENVPLQQRDRLWRLRRLAGSGERAAFRRGGLGALVMRKSLPAWISVRFCSRRVG